MTPRPLHAYIQANPPTLLCTTICNCLPVFADLSAPSVDLYQIFYFRRWLCQDCLLMNAERAINKSTCFLMDFLHGLYHPSEGKTMRGERRQVEVRWSKQVNNRRTEAVWVFASSELWAQNKKKQKKKKKRKAQIKVIARHDKREERKMRWDSR